MGSLKRKEVKITKIFWLFSFVVFSILAYSSPVIANPFFVSEYSTLGSADNIHLSGNYAYFTASKEGLIILDISDVFNPLITGTYTPEGAERMGGAYFTEDRAYIADDTGMYILDISDPTNTLLLGKYIFPLSRYVEGVYISGDYAYLADYDAGMLVVDVSDPKNPKKVGSYFPFGITDMTSYDGGSSTGFRGIHVSGKYAYATGSQSLEKDPSKDLDLAVLDISNPANPILVGAFNALSAPYDVYVSRDYAYISQADLGLFILDISDPSNPSFIGGYNPSPTTIHAFSTYISGNYSFVASGREGDLQILDISNPNQVTLVGEYFASDSPGNDVIVSGDYAYLARDNGLDILDISYLTKSPKKNIVAQKDIESDSKLSDFSTKKILGLVMILAGIAILAWSGYTMKRKGIKPYILLSALTGWISILTAGKGNLIKKVNLKYVAAGFIALLIFGGGYFAVSSFTGLTSCDNSECFIEAANKCSNAEMLFTEDAGTFYYTSSKNCVLTKILVEPDEGETEEMKELLTMKEMTCSYKKNEFYDGWVESLTDGIDNCEGDLAETITLLIPFAKGI